MFKALDDVEETLVEESIEKAVEEVQTITKSAVVDEVQNATTVEEKVKRSFSEWFLSLFLGCSSAKTHVIETAPLEPSQNNV